MSVLATCSRKESRTARFTCKYPTLPWVCWRNCGAPCARPGVRSIWNELVLSRPEPTLTFHRPCHDHLVGTYLNLKRTWIDVFRLSHLVVENPLSPHLVGTFPLETERNNSNIRYSCNNTSVVASPVGVLQSYWQCRHCDAGTWDWAMEQTELLRLEQTRRSCESSSPPPPTPADPLHCGTDWKETYTTNTECPTPSLYSMTYWLCEYRSLLKSSIFWDITPWSPLKVKPTFRKNM
jgi:hypothetical protein